MAKSKSGIRCSVTAWEGQVKECTPVSPPITNYWAQVLWKA